MQEPVNRAQRTGARERKYVRRFALLECIEDQHRGYREQAEGRQRVYPDVSSPGCLSIKEAIMATFGAG